MTSDSRLKGRIAAIAAAAALVLTFIPAFPVTANAEAKITSATDNAFSTIMKPVLNKANGDQTNWENYLAAEWKKASDQFSWASPPTNPPKWSGVTASTTGGAPETNPTDIPAQNNEGLWEVYSGEQMLYAFEQLKNQSDSGLRLMADIDLNGTDKLWDDPMGLGVTVNAKGYENITIDGNGHTIYNLGTTDGGWVDKITSGTVKNLKFVSAKVMTGAPANSNYAGIIRDINGTGTSHSQISNMEVRDSLFFDNFASNNPVTDRTYLSPLGHSEFVDAENVYTMNNMIYGGTGVHIGGAFAKTGGGSITNSFSVDSILVSAGEHSGGFLSCTDGEGGTYPVTPTGELVVSQCFTNNTVYGSRSTGVFVGGVNPFGKSTFTDCYASGSIEGQKELGGFVGLIGGSGSEAVSFKNCYSTSIVGMRKSGESLGGFAGAVQGTNTKFTDCYAAGEVGHIDTDVSQNRTGYETVGGFAGSVAASNTITFTDCYYDKQTTAMREWETGKTQDSAINLKPGLDTTDMAANSYNGHNNIDGIRGVLTSDSDKSGAGLASKPNTSSLDAGFNGFGTSSDWVYDGGSASDQHNCAYPQLTGFYNAEDSVWGAHKSTVQAFSFASAATVHQQVWDTCINPAHKTLPTTTYDTVRDLTLRFTMSSYLDAPQNTGTTSISWSQDNADVTLYGEQDSRPVIGFFDEIYNAAYQRSYQTADEFAPGITWLTVNVTVGEGANAVTGTRRLRIVPTANMEPGEDKDLMADDSDTTKWYDHADGVKLAYSTGSRMNADTTDITQSVFPSTAATGAYFYNQYVNNGNAWTPTGNTMPASFTADDNKFTQLSTEYLTGPKRSGTSDHTPNTYISVAMYPAVVNKVEVNGQTFYQLVADRTNPKPLQNADGSPTDTAMSLNGLQAFKNADAGRYILEYTWALADARYIRASNMLLIQPSEHGVKSKVVTAEGSGAAEVLTPTGDALRLASESYADHSAPTIPQPTFTADTVAEYAVMTPAGNPVVLAAQKPADAPYKITEIRVDFKMLEGVQTHVFQNPAIGQTIQVPLTYYYGSAGLNSEYTVQAKEVVKEYELAYDFVNQYYYLALKYNKSLVLGGNTVPISDIDADLDITYIVEKYQEFEIVSKVTTESGAGGSITLPGGGSTTTEETTTAAAGSTYTYTFQPGAGSHVKDVLVDGISYGPLNSYTFDNVNVNHTLEVIFDTAPAVPIGNYAISYNYGGGGTVKALDVLAGNTDLPSANGGKTTVAAGSNQKYEVKADAGYVIDRVVVDGALLTDSNGNPVTNVSELNYLFADVQENHSLQVTFVMQGTAALHYLIHSYVESGDGEITPAGYTPVAPNGSQSYTITADTDWELSEVKVDGVVDTTKPSTYTFSNVAENHEICVTFTEKAAYPITARVVDENGAPVVGCSVDPASADVQHGADQAFTVTLTDGYQIKEAYFIKDGETIETPLTPNGNEVTLSAAESAGEVTVVVEKKQYQVTVEVNDPSGASVAPSDPKTVTHGADTDLYTFTVTDGYRLTEVVYTKNGGGDEYAVTPNASGEFQLANVTADIHFIVRVEPIPEYTVTASIKDGVGGVLDITSDIVREGNDSAVFTVTAEPGYSVTSIAATGAASGTVTNLNAGSTFQLTDVRENIDVVVTLAIIPEHNVEIKVVGDAGGITSTPAVGITPVQENGSFDYNILPNEGYVITDVTVTDALGNTQTVTPNEDGSYSGNISNITGDHTVTVTVAKKVYDVTVRIEGEGSGAVTPFEDKQVTHGEDSETYVITPAEGFRIASVTINGEAPNPAQDSYLVHADGTASLQLTGVKENKEIVVTFEKITHEVTVIPGTGGTVNPGTTDVEHGTQAPEYTVTPDPGYVVDQVIVTGTETGKKETPIPNADGSFTVTDPITEDTVIEVTFKKIPYEVTTETGAGGKISPSEKQTVLYGEDSPTYQITPDTGYKIKDITVNGHPYGSTPSSLKLTEVKENKHIVVSFEKIKYNVTAEAGTGGSITPAGTTQVEHGGSTPNYTITPEPGYKIKDVIVNGQSKGPMESIQLDNITESKYIKVEFERIDTPTPTPKPTEPTTPPGPTTPPSPTSPPKVDTPDTGDASTPAVWWALTAVFGIGTLLLILRRRNAK